MRILDITLFYPPQAGGAVTTTLEFIKALIKCGHEVEVLAPSIRDKVDSVSPNEAANQEHPDRIVHRIKLIEFFKKWTVCYSYLVYAVKNLRSKEFDAILAHFHFTTAIGWAGLLLSRIFGCSLYIRIHDLYEPKTFKHKVMFFLNKIPLKYCTKILTINHVSKQMLIDRRIAPPHKIEIIPNGVSGLTYNSEIVKRKNKVGFLGTISRNRGIDLLIPLIVELKRDLPDVEIHIVGEGPGLNSLVHKLQEQDEVIRNSFIIHGALERHKAIEVISGMDVCIGLLERSNTNDYQLLIKLIEYIHLGIPWVSVSTKGVEEFYHNTRSGLITNEELHSITAAISKLLTNEELYKEKVSNGLENKSFYDWEYIAWELNSVLVGNRGVSNESVGVRRSV